MHRNGKPVRKCHGCPLNLRDRCGAYDSPHDQWHNKKMCSGYKNAALVEQYEARLAQASCEPEHERRPTALKSGRTASHHQDVRPPRLRRPTARPAEPSRL